MNSEQIYQNIKSDILSFKLLPGALISENELAKQYNVSRTPIKSAFLRLMAEQFIQIEPQRGTYVTKLDLDRIKDIIYMRTTIEREIFSSAIDHLRTPVLEALTSNLELQRKLVSQREFEPQLFYKLDSEFHRAVFACEDRLSLWEIIQEFQVYYTRFRMLDILATSSFAQLLREHEELYKALENRDKPRLGRVLDAHLSGNLTRLGPKIPTEFAEFFLPQASGNR